MLKYKGFQFIQNPSKYDWDLEQLSLVEQQLVSVAGDWELPWYYYDKGYGYEYSDLSFVWCLKGWTIVLHPNPNTPICIWRDNTNPSQYSYPNSNMIGMGLMRCVMEYDKQLPKFNLWEFAAKMAAAQPFDTYCPCGSWKRYFERIYKPA